MKKIVMTLLTCLAFIGSANTDSLTDTDKAAQKALAEQYVQALQERDVKLINRIKLINYYVYADRILENIVHKETQSKKDFILQGMLIDTQKELQKIYFDSIDVRLLGWRKSSSFSGYIIRLISQNYVPTYLGLIMEKINNQWVIVDFYDVVVQKNISDIKSHTINQIFPNADYSITGRLLKNNKVAELEKVTDFLISVQQKDGKNAIKFYDTLSNDLKKNEVIIDRGLLVADNYDDEQFYKGLLTIIAKYHQKNPKYSGRLVDYFLMNKSYDKARLLVQNGFTSLSDNAMMNLLLTNISFTEKDYPRALQEIKQCVKAEPNLQPCYEMWINVADAMQNYNEVVTAYNTASKNLGIQYTKSMFNEKEDGDFMRSDAFKNWDIPEKSE